MCVCGACVMCVCGASVCNCPSCIFLSSTCLLPWPLPLHPDPVIRFPSVLLLQEYVGTVYWDGRGTLIKRILNSLCKRHARAVKVFPLEIQGLPPHCLYSRQSTSAEAQNLNNVPGILGTPTSVPPPTSEGRHLPLDATGLSNDTLGQPRVGLTCALPFLVKIQL